MRNLKIKSKNNNNNNNNRYMKVMQIMMIKKQII